MSIVSTNTKLQEALRLAQLGYHVFPLHGTTDGRCDCSRADCSKKEAGKHPTQVSSWTTQATTDPEIIKRWWTNQPNANVAIRTGKVSNILVTDCDINDSGDGFLQLQAIDPEKRSIDDWQTGRAKTGSGGYHLYFACPAEPLTIASKIDGKNIDLRCNGGYVAAPPSVNGSGAYQWIQHPADGELMECPAWLIEFLKKGGGKKSLKNQSAVASADSVPTLKFVVEPGLAEHPGASEGDRNSTLCKLVGGELAAGAEPDDVIKQAIAWNARCNPPKAEAGIIKSVQALINSDSANRTGIASLQATPLLLGLQPTVAGYSILVTRRASDIKPQVLKWLWANHIQLGAVNLIAGPEGRGKSLVAVDIAARTSTGSPWPDGSPCEGGRVLYCSAEENIEAVVVPRLMAAGADLSKIEIVDGLGSSSDAGRVIADVDLKKCLPEVYRKLKEGDEPFRLCIWDTFQSCSLTTNHKENTEQKAIVQPLQAIADELGVAIICIEHHNRAGIGRGNPDAAILGGGLTRTARVIWHVIEDPEDKESTRLFIPGKMNNCSKAEDLGWKFTFAEVERTIEGKQVKLPRIDWLEAAGVTIHEVQERVNSLGDAKSKEDHTDEFHRACEWLKSFLTEARLYDEVKAGWKSEMLSERTIRRAKAHLLIGSEQRSRKWYWLPSPTVSIGAEIIAGPHIANT